MRAGKAGRALFMISCAWTVTALAARLPHMGWISPVGTAQAQETGHGGGHTGGKKGGGGHTDGDHDDGTTHDDDHDGDAGHTGGPGGHGRSASAGSAVTAAQNEVSSHGSPFPPKPAGAMRDPDYFRFALGYSVPSASSAYWLSPGYPGDPKVAFSVDVKNAGYAAVALGHYWRNGIRSEIALSAFGDSAFSTPPGSTGPGSTGTHAAMSGKTSSVAVMGNGYYTPYIKALGRVQPYVSAGLGFAINTMGTWTRTNLTKGDPVRGFEGATAVAPAASLGVGVEVYLGELGGRPASLDLGYRYFYLGNVTGGTTPASGSGSMPVKAFNFNKTEQVVSASLRLWF